MTLIYILAVCLTGLLAPEYLTTVNVEINDAFGTNLTEITMFFVGFIICCILDLLFGS